MTAFLNNDMHLPYNRNWYPIKHFSGEEQLSPGQVGDHFAMTDWKDENTFQPWHLEWLPMFMRMDKDDQWDNHIQLTDKIRMEADRKPVAAFDYPVEAYANDMLEMFDSHMTSLVEQFKGKYTLFNSGGIDSGMMAAWFIKNKIDFENVFLLNSVRNGAITDSVCEKTFTTWSKVSESKIITIDRHETVKDYILNHKHNTIPKHTNCNLDGYDSQMSEMLLQDCDWLVRGAGSNYTMLHTVKSVGVSYVCMDNSWKPLLHTSAFQDLSMGDLGRYSYNELGDSPMFYNPAYEYWAKASPKNLEMAGWTTYAHNGFDKDYNYLTLVNEEWYNLYERIDWSGMNHSIYEKLMSCEIWKDYISKHVSNEVAESLRTTRHQTDYYTPNDENTKLISQTFADLKQRFKGNFRLIKEVLAHEWILKKFKRVTFEGLGLCTLEKHLQHRKI